MIRLSKFLIYLIILSVAGEVQLKAQTQSMSVEGHIVAEVVPIFSATETSQLNFGRFSPGHEGGEIILTPESSVSVLGSVFAGSGIKTAACFYISGDENASFNIRLPDNPVIIKHVSSSKTMIIDNWISSPNPTSGSGILQKGEQLVYVGATLKVKPVQDNPIGVYAGSYIVSFDFN